MIRNGDSRILPHPNAIPERPEFEAEQRRNLEEARAKRFLRMQREMNERLRRIEETLTR